MGTTHWRSDISGQDGTEKIEGFKGIKFGTDSCIIYGTKATAATLEAAATSFLGGTPSPGCMYLSSKAAGGGMFVRQSAAASWTRLMT